MTALPVWQTDPKLDLVLQRVIDVSPELVWLAWTTPEHVRQWFTPRPWTTAECEIDLRPGGIFSTLMRSPEGETFPNIGCYLEVVPGQRLAWTNALLPGYRPKAAEQLSIGFPFTAVVEVQATGAGTLYTATVMHPDEAAKQKHEEMGFFDGWGTALDQLVEYVKTL